MEIQDKEDKSYYIKDILVANWYLYLLSDNQSEKESLWSKCKELFNQLGDTELHEEHLDFIREFIRKEKVDLDKIIDVIERLDLGYGKHDTKIQLIEEVIDTQSTQDAFTPNYHVRLLVMCAHIAGNYAYKGSKNLLTYCDKAKELLTEIDDEEEGYWENKIIQVRVKIMSNDDAYEYDEVNVVRKQCNYYIIAEHECLGVDNEKKIEIWNDAADDYGFIDDYMNQIRCLEQSYAIILPILNQYDYSMFNYSMWQIMYNQIIAWIKIKEYEKAHSVIREIYVKTLDYYETREDEKWEYIYKMKDIADLYVRAEDYKCAMRGYLMWIYVMLSESRDKRILNDYFDDIQDMKVVCDELILVIPNAKSDDVDSLIEFKDAVEKLNIEGQELQIIQPLLDIIARDYQNKEVEFK
jgi:hypothetical protein